MHRYDLISCHDCGVLHRRRPVRPREKARCVRCRSIMYRGMHSDASRMAAIILTALIVYVIAQCFPIVELEVNGNVSRATLLGAIVVLWQGHMPLVAAAVFLFTILLPAVELLSLLHVTLSLAGGHKPKLFNVLLYAVHLARRWGMTEVLMIGILITIVKMTSLATVVLEPGLFAFAALTLMLAIVVSFDPKMLWNLGDALAPQPDVPPPVPQAALACHVCGLVSADSGTRRQDCPRCHARLHHRHPDSLGRTWALLIAAAILYVPANLLPVMYTHSLFGLEDDTIISGVLYFWDSGSPALASIIFVASILVPLLKLAALSLLAWTAQRRSRWRPLQRTRLYRMVEFVGRWSMLDIFVITLTVALVRFQTLATITAGPGALAFCAVVVLTMLASMQFDPRLIWDPVPPNGEQHA
ncbi:paraquat-inducible protein A [Pseudoduganella sp. R-43]|uniref:paraquat-inducible protein A n=1 Tax=Pseudoduganella sp. R-43 TaxID=3404063 RepID=UPI003CF0AF75